MRTLCLLLVSFSAFSQDYSFFTETLQKLEHPNSVAGMEETWNTLAEKGQVPLIENDSVAFMYRGKANSVEWIGDFNNWGYEKIVPSKGRRLDSLDIWIWKTSFPTNARLDYKISIDGSIWILDPINLKQQLSGLGGGSPNSELCMPEWKQDPITFRMEGIQRGEIKKDQLLTSNVLGYQLSYSVYIPAGHTSGEKLPVVYVMDGYEYMHEDMGNMITILDNLIALKKIHPIVAIFIDQREPANRANNRKMQELTMNQKYLTFLTDELIPFIESRYPIVSDPKSRAILGNDMGGLSSAYFAFAVPETFGMAGIQSPSFWFKPEIYTFCDNPANPPVKIFMTSGLFSDFAEGTRKMKDILDKNTCTYQYLEVNQGHSWGNWRDTIDDILIYLFPVG